MSREYLRKKTYLRPRKKTYLRPCKRCDNLFSAYSKYSYLCDKCKKKSDELKNKKMLDYYLKKQNEKNEYKRT
uniref:Uncharacterized protein n=1 Tax=viral metagenome TaxID=1070528 RepID=A0A6M3LTI0_9ZZZZ